MRFLFPISTILVVLSLMVAGGALPTHAQTTDPESTSTPLIPSPFPLVPSEAATSSSPATAAPEATTTLEQPAPAPAVSPTTTSKKTSTPVKKASSSTVLKKVASPSVATTSASTTASGSISSPPISPPVLAAEPQGNIYTYAAHPPLNIEETLQLLGLALLCGFVGFLLVQRRLLERTSVGIATLFSPRSLPRPQAERQ